MASRRDCNHKGEPQELSVHTWFGLATKSPLTVISRTAGTVNQRDHIKENNLGLEARDEASIDSWCRRQGLP
jgi:hypothetical protein